MTHPFARGPMTGSALDILGNLYASAASPPRKRHSDARLLELGRRHPEILQEIEQNHAKHVAISLLVREECGVPIELSTFARMWDRKAAENDMAAPSGRFIAMTARDRIDDPTVWWPAALTKSDKLAILERYQAALEASFERHGEAAVTAHDCVLERDEEAILNEIRDTPALTIAGIVVKLRAAAALGEWCEGSPDEGYFDRLMGETLRNAEKLAETADEGRQEAGNHERV